MSAALLTRTHQRLAAGEPLRILIGHRLVDATEIVPAAAFREVITSMIGADLAAQILALSPPDPESPGPQALPVGETQQAGEAALRIKQCQV